MLRRNGKPRSCEPCRISKIRCDHATPTCAKCVARGMADQCFYHPSPMTKPAGTPRKKPEPRRPRAIVRSSQDVGRLTSLTLSPPTLRNEVNAVSSGNSWPTPPTSASRARQSASDPVRSFYLGSTSYASVFQEDGPLPDTVHQQPSERMSAAPSQVSNKSTGTSRHCQIGVGHSLVARLSPFSFFEKTIRDYFETSVSSVLIGPLVLSFLPQLREDMQQLTAPGADIAQMYADMTRNTAKPLKIPPEMLPSEFYTAVTGANLRWETIGLVLALAAVQAGQTHPKDSSFTLEDGSKVDKDEFIGDMIQATNDCIALCQTHGAVNDVMVWLVCCNMHITRRYYGDNYHGTWRRMGESISALYANGMHCESEAAKSEPVFLREARRRIHASIYMSDKTLALFLGRPPMMVWRYSDRRLLLDVSDEAICSDTPEVFNEAILSLNARGWNTDGKIYAASYFRLRCQHAVYKERLLEQSLAGEKDSDVIGNLQVISTELTQFWESVPSQLRYDMYPEDSAWTDADTNVTTRLHAIYLEHLHMHFQIQRMMHRLTQQALPALLATALQLLATSLASIKSTTNVHDTRARFSTVYHIFCFPAAGLLALHLRRSTMTNTPLPSTVSRAAIVRNLSVLTSCLEWILQPSDGNYKLCTELNKILTMVLDQVLNFPTSVPDIDGGVETLQDSWEVFDSGVLEGLEPIPTEAEEFLNWLDHASWSNNVALF